MTKRISAAIIVLLLANMAGIACTCRPFGDFTRKEFNDLRTIFIGTVIEEHFNRQENGFIVKFTVKKLYKGKADSGFVYAFNTASSCKLYVQKGDNFLMFLSGVTILPQVSACTRMIKIGKMDSFEIPEWLSKCLNVKDGYEKLTLADGTLSSEGRIVNNLPEGRWIYYDKTGQIKSEGNYMHGLKDSIWTDYSNGLRIQEIEYKNDVMDGRSTGYYSNGIIESEFNSQNGKQHGKAYGRNYDGTLAWEYTYDMDRLIEQKRYSEEGKQVYYKGETLEINWYKDGTMQSEVKFKNGLIVRMKYWLENGQLQRFSKYDSARNESVIYALGEKGEVMVVNGTGYYNYGGEEGYYKDSVKVGAWKQEFNNGESEETNYSKGIKHGSYVRRNKDNKVMYRGEYKNGNRYGVWKCWYSNGQIQLETKEVKGENLYMNFWDPQGKQMIKNGNGTYYYYDNDGNPNPYSKNIVYINGKPKE